MFRGLIKSNRFVFCSKKFYRDVRDTYHYFPDDRYRAGGRGNPYLKPFSLTEEEKALNEKLPIEERLFDWDKYMKHTGKLKPTSGKYLEDVEAFPRMKIMMLCDIILQKLAKIPDDFGYKEMSFEYTKFIMKVTDENENIIELLDKLNKFNTLEELIQALHNEVTLLTTVLGIYWLMKTKNFGKPLKTRMMMTKSLMKKSSYLYNDNKIGWSSIER